MILNSLTKNRISSNLKQIRLNVGLTQEGLSLRSGVAISTLRKFEKTGSISLDSFLKLCMSLGCLEDVVNSTKPKEVKFNSIEEVIAPPKKKRQRGWQK